MRAQDPHISTTISSDERLTPSRHSIIFKQEKSEVRLLTAPIYLLV
jgi:hypothetical protein